MRIQKMKTGLLKPHEKNPRNITESVIEKVADSIREHGFNQPILVNQDNVICVGHARFAAAKKLGLKTVPVYKKEMTEEQHLTYMLADNKTGEAATWDVGMLREVVVSLEKFEVDLDTTGFSEIELESLMDVDDPIPPDDDGEDVPDDEGDAPDAGVKSFTIQMSEKCHKEFTANLEKIKELRRFNDTEAVLLAVEELAK